jgi:4-coumarate--CoA ligase
MVSNLTQMDVFEDQINHENIFIGTLVSYNLFETLSTYTLN